MKFKLKDPGSAITHGIAFLLAAVGAAPLLIRSSAMNDHLHIVALSIFILTMMLLYAASTLYHSVDSTAKVNRRLKKMDHMMIFVMIAGSYTPICLIVLHNKIGYALCALVWATAILGIIFKAFWVTCPKWVSSVIYTVLGWSCLIFFKDIYMAVPLKGFLWLLAGGIFYTVGAVIYAMKLKIFARPWHGFGNHEIFHCFVLAGSLCHFIFVYQYLVMLG